MPVRNVTNPVYVSSDSIAEVKGEWHEMEAKQDRARKRHQEGQALAAEAAVQTKQA